MKLRKFWMNSTWGIGALVLAFFLIGTILFLFSQSKSLGKEEILTKKKIKEKTSNLVVWGWDESHRKSLDIFRDLNKDITIKYVTIDSKEYIKKLKVTLAVGGEIPDVVFMENDTRWDFMKMDMWEQLDQPPYNFDKNEILSYIYPNIMDEHQRVVAVPYDISVAGMAYRKADARAYFGTDDPDKLEKILGNWSAFISQGKNLRERSNHRKYMISSLRDFSVMINNQVTEPFVQKNQFVGLKHFEETIKDMIKMRDSDIVEGTQQWGPSWYASFSKESAVFYPCPGWFIRYVIEPNDATGVNKWGLMVPPEGGFVWGGTAMGIPRNSKNKEAAWRYIKWLLLTEEGAKLNRENLNGMFTHYKKSYEDPDFVSIKESYFGEQDVGKMYLEKIFPTAKTRIIGPDDANINDAMDVVSVAIMKDRKITATDAIKLFKRILAEKLPTLIIQ